MIGQLYVKYVTNGFHFTKENGNYEKAIIVNNILPIGIFLFLFYGFVNLFATNFVIVALKDFIIAASFILLLMYFRKTHDVKRVCLGIVLLLMVFLCFYVYIVENHHFSIFWTVLLPVIAYTLLDYRQAAAITIVFYLIVFAIVFSQYSSWEPVPFNSMSFINFGMGTITLVGAIGYFEMGRQQAYKRIEKENKRIENTQIILVQQKERIEEQSRSLLSSIEYAEKIQQKILPSFGCLKNNFSDGFLFFQPKELVSGDFYWFQFQNNKLVLALADCTGHGVPGAFMSMLGISFLNDIFIKAHKLQPSDALNMLNSKIKYSIQQENETSSPIDGIKIGLLILDMDTNKAQFAGAGCSMYYFKKNVCQVLEGEKKAIGRNKSNFQYTINKDFQIERGDAFYLFTDGFSDQLHFESRERYNTQRFYALVNRISSFPMSQQHSVIKKEYEQWKGTDAQIDDVTIIGLKI